MGSATAQPSTPRPPLDNLPLELTSFVGRDREVAEIKGLLSGRRLLTLCGPGGSGKTRLALAVAQDLVEEFEDGVWWVELAPLSAPSLVPRAVASAVGVSEVPELSLAEVLVEHLRPTKTLLILDNCEHLIEECADLADTLLRTCPRLEILATSREPLRISGESSWQVPSLSLPDAHHLPSAGELVGYEAVHLFVERARAVDAGFSLTEGNAAAVARLCRKLDGIPLAIELAAARSRVLSVEQILAKLEDPLGLLTTGDRSAAPRQKTLRATLEWSYDLLGEAERALFRRLSVFVGGWDLEAAEAVGVGEPVQAGLALDLLSALVDKSLVVAENAGGALRYGMLEPVRQFGREKLHDSQEEPEVRRQHAEHYLDLAETAGPELLGPDQGLWLQRLRTEFANLREAHTWSLEPGEEEERARLRLRLPAALWRFWGGQRFEEGKVWLQTALERDPGEFPAVRARALDGFGFILLFQQDYGRAIAALEEAIALYKEFGDRSGTAFALANFGYAVLHGDYRERVPAFVREAEALMAGDLDDHPRAYLRIVVACATLGRGDLDSAVEQIEEGLALCRELGDLRNTAMSLFILGMTVISRGDLDRGTAQLEEGARITRELGDRLGATYSTLGLGKVSVLRGRPVRAARLWGAAEALREQMGMSLSRFDLAGSGYEQDLAAVRTMLNETSFDAAWAEGRAMSFEQAIEYALEEPTSPYEEVPAETSSPTYSPVELPAEDTGGDLRNNLPAAQTGFVGREREMSEVGRTLSMTRLLTLTGAGGCGKTRLALEVARDIVGARPGDYPDGVWLVELDSLTDGELVPGAVAAALGVREQPERSFTEVLVDSLRSRRMLLILDNCEHLIEACAGLVDTLLGACEDLRVMATSREALGVEDEVNWIVPSLTVPDATEPPDPENLTRYEAVQLFVERARSRQPGFSLTPENAPAVVDICLKLDGIPLAIELATARMGALTVEQIAGRLDDYLGFITTGGRTRVPRQRTLRAAIAWGYELLSEPEQELFKRLSVFVGGWTLEAAETVGAAEDVHAGEVLDLLSRLANKSFVIAETETAEVASRYRMLEPIRTYALELLDESPRSRGVRDRHAAAFTSLAKRAHTELRGSRQVEWMQRLDRENGNFRAAMAWTLSSGDFEAAASLGWALWPYWFYRGNHREGRHLMERVLEGAVGLSAEVRRRATVAVAVMAYGQGDDEGVVEHMTDLLELSRQVGGDAYAEAYARAGLGLVAMNRGDLVRAAARLEEALPLFLESGELWTAAQTHTWLGTVLLLQGDQERAVVKLEEGLALARWIGDRAAIYNALYTLARAALIRGEHPLATNSFKEGVGLSEEMGDLANVAYCLEGLAAVAGAQGRTEISACLFGAAQCMLETIGVPVWTFYKPDRSLYERTMNDLRERMGAAAFEAAFSKGLVMSPRRVIEYALDEAVPDQGPGQPAAESASPSTIAPPPEPEDHQERLRILALGPARVEKEGVALDSPDWIHKSRELLYYLLSHPEGRTKEQIGLALWPEASTAQLRSSFHDTVYRLRRALGGKEWVSFEKRRYFFDRSLDYSYDIETFEEDLSEGRRLQTESPDLAIQHLQRAAGLYRGDFLEDIAQSEWAFARQDELRRAYGESLLLLGGLLLDQRRHTEAAEAYRKAIAHDRFLEEAHRGLMRSQAALGERGRALKHYEELAVLLEEHLGATPAPETVALYESLRSGRSAAGSGEIGSRE